MLRREWLSTLAQRWRSLDQANRDAWVAFGKNIQRTNSLGDTYNLTGLQSYILFNVNRFLAGLARVDSPPAVITPVVTLSSLELEIDTTVNEMNIVFTPTPLQETALYIKAAPPLSAGVMFIAPGLFRFIKVVTPTGTPPQVTSPINIYTDYVNKFGSIPIGSKIAVEVTPAAWPANAAERGLTGIPLRVAEIVTM